MECQIVIVPFGLEEAYQLFHLDMVYQQLTVRFRKTVQSECDTLDVMLHILLVMSKKFKETILNQKTIKTSVGQSIQCCKLQLLYFSRQMQ